MTGGCAVLVLQAAASAVSRATASGGGSASAGSSATAVVDAVTNTLAGGGSVAREWPGDWQTLLLVTCAARSLFIMPLRLHCFAPIHKLARLGLPQQSILMCMDGCWSSWLAGWCSSWCVPALLCHREGIWWHTECACLVDPCRGCCQCARQCCWRRRCRCGSCC